MFGPAAAKGQTVLTILEEPADSSSGTNAARLIPFPAEPHWDVLPCTASSASLA